MNLLFVLPAYEPAWAFGGVVRAMSSLCRGLAALGHRVTVYTTNSQAPGVSGTYPIGEAVDMGGVATYYFPPTFGPGRVWDSHALRQRLSLTVGQFQLVYVSAIWQWLGVATAAICAARQVPLVVGPHGSLDQSLRRRRRWRKALYWHGFLKRSLRRAAALHFTTEYERRESADLLSGWAGFVVPNALDCDYFRPRPETRPDFRRRCGLAPEVPVVLAVGRPDGKKRLDLLIESLARLPELHLLVVGPDQGLVAHGWKALAAQMGMAGRVVFTGHLAGETLVQAYAAGDILALLSEDENFGNVVTEAMACGLPVLVSPGVGVWEEVTEAQVGRMVPLNMAAVVEALGDFLRERARWAAWGQNCRRVAQERFGSPTVAALMGRALEDVLTGARSPECRWREGSRA